MMAIDYRRHMEARDRWSSIRARRARRVLTPAGRFWRAYFLGAGTAVALVSAWGYVDAVRGVVGL